jgi:drug/metabolite transporter (DMT)-like permease
VQLLWTTIAGFLVFGTLPDQLTWVGATIIVATGLHSALRERQAVPALLVVPGAR